MSITQKQIALSNFPYYKCSMTYTLDSLQRLGAEAIELYAVEPHFHIDDVKPWDVTLLKRNLARRGIRPICLTPEQMRYPINIASSSLAVRQRSMDVFTKCIQYASELECPLVQFHGGYPLMDEAVEPAWERSAVSLARLSELAEVYGVTISLEFVDIRWKTVLRNSLAVAKMIERVGAPNLKGMIDLICLTVCNETIEDALANLNDNVVHCHFTDGTGRRDSTLHIVPGEGVLDLDHIIQTLGDAGYGGYLSVELMSPYEEEPEKAMTRAVRWMRTHLPE